MTTLVHDYLTQRGGAERVVLAMTKAFPGAPLHTSLYEPEMTYSGFAGVDVRTGALNRVATFRRDHRKALPLLAMSFEKLEITDDVVLCSSSAWSHATRVRGRKIVYCHSPPRWLHRPSSYRRGGLGTATALAVARASHRGWDRRAAATAEQYIVNSRIVRDWVWSIYGIEAEVLAPPNTIDPTAPRTPVADLDPGFVLCVSRLLPYKNVDVVCAVAERMPNTPFVVVGTGPEHDALRAAAPANVRFLGEIDDATLRWLYGAAGALVACSFEDFGLTPIEAAAFGTPTVALRLGGYLDTVVDGVTGIFVDELDPVAIACALREALASFADAAPILEHADLFSEARFVDRLRGIAEHPALVPNELAVADALRSFPAALAG